MKRGQKSDHLSREMVTSLNDRLPTGYLEIIQSRVSNKDGEPYTQAYISLVKNGKRENLEILEALLVLCEEHEEKKRRFEKRVINS